MVMPIPRLLAALLGGHQCDASCVSLSGILNGFDAGQHNGRVEVMNRALQEAPARARGYRRVENFIAMAYLVAGRLTRLPTPPFAQMALVPHKTE